MEKTDNELIAEFMGGIKKEHPMSTIGYWDFPDYPAEGHARQVKHLKYDISWDWLMPVVEKINNLYSENFPPDFVQRMLSGDKEIIDHHYMDVIAIPLASSISEAYANTVTFIKWYNSQNS